MRVIYSALFYWLLPLLFLRLYWRSFSNPAYGQRWQERLAIYPEPAEHQVVWFHAVSVGEVESLAALVNRLLDRFPAQQVLITTTTPTGSARVQALFQGRIAHVYLPYDTPDAIGRFLRHFRPRLAVIMETEIWPNLYAGCAKNAIPLYLINARLTEKSVRGYQKIGFLVRPALSHVKLIAAQSQQNAERYLSIGALPGRVMDMGNIKFDMAISAQLIAHGHQIKDSLFAGRYVWLLASTHEDEERQLLGSYRQLKQRIPELLLAVAPRHPERFQPVKELFLQAGFSVAARSLADACEKATDVYLVDTMGELKLFYAAADVAFVGGSLVPAGGHNILEPAAIGTPIIIGPWMGNFKEITTGILEKKAALQCQCLEDIAGQVYGLYANTEFGRGLVANGKSFVFENQGATEKIMDLLAVHFAT